MIQKGNIFLKKIGKIHFTYDSSLDQMKYEDTKPELMIGYDQMSFVSRFIRQVCLENKKLKFITLGDAEVLIRDRTDDIPIYKVKIKFD